MALQKFRVICPYCEAALLVTEDLLGQPGTCPGCQQDFLLPDLGSFLSAPAPITESELFPPQPLPQTPVPPPFAAGPAPVTTPFPAGGLEIPIGSSPPPKRSGSCKPVRMEGRPALRLLSILLKVLAGLQVVLGCLLLIGMVFLAVRNPIRPELVLTMVGTALSIGVGAIPMLAFSELILVFIAQEEMLRHLVNHQREKSTRS